MTGHIDKICADAAILRLMVLRRLGCFSKGTFAAVTGLGPREAGEALYELLAQDRVRPLPKALSGLYEVVPGRLGLSRDAFDPPYEAVTHLHGNEPYFLGFATALALHGVTEAHGDRRLCIALSRSCEKRTVLGNSLVYVRLPQKDFYGITQMEIYPQVFCKVTDLERSLLDVLRRPALCGGVEQVLLWAASHREEIDGDKLVFYALHQEVGAVKRRVGFLLDACDIQAPRDKLLKEVEPGQSYLPLDGSRPHKGLICPTWRLTANTPGYLEHGSDALPGMLRTGKPLRASKRGLRQRRCKPKEDEGASPLGGRRSP